MQPTNADRFQSSAILVRELVDQASFVRHAVRERLGPRQALGTAFVLAGVLIGQNGRRRVPSPAPSTVNESR